MGRLPGALSIRVSRPEPVRGVHGEQECGGCLDGEKVLWTDGSAILLGHLICYVAQDQATRRAELFDYNLQV
jgi:hypothetical protein